MQRDARARAAFGGPACWQAGWVSRIGPKRERIPLTFAFAF